MASKSAILTGSGSGLGTGDDADRGVSSVSVLSSSISSSNAPFPFSLVAANGIVVWPPGLSTEDKRDFLFVLYKRIEVSIGYIDLISLSSFVVFVVVSQLTSWASLQHIERQMGCLLCSWLLCDLPLVGI